MWVLWNYIRCICRSRSSIWKQTNLVWCNSWINMRWHAVMRMWWHALMRLFWHAWIIIGMILMDVLSMHNPWNIFFKETLGGKCLVHHGHMNKIFWCETYAHFCYHHNYKKQIIYHDHLNCGRDKVWSKT